MTQYDDDADDYTDEQHDDGGDSRDNRNLRQLREKAKKADKLEAELNSLRRERLFDQAGIPDNAKTRYFRKGYDGDTTLDAIKAAAVEAGFLEVEDSGELDEEFEAMERVDRATAGQQPAGSGQITPNTYASWSQSKRRAFQAQHPELVDALKQGQAVNASF